MDDLKELLPIVDDCGNVVGSAMRGECHDGVSMILHPVVHLHIIDHHGHILLQKRSGNKRIQPGRWDTAVGGHIGYGETVAMALSREAEEEVGLINVENANLVASYIFKSKVERELVNCHILHLAEEFIPEIGEPDDIDELRFWSVSDVMSAVGTGVFTPNFEQEFVDLLYPCLSNYADE